MGRRGYPPEFRRKVLDLVEAGRSVADVARDLEISDQSIYTWRRQDRIDRGLVPGLSSGERAELAKAKLRIAELRRCAKGPVQVWARPHRPCPPRAHSTGIWRSLTVNSGPLHTHLTCAIGVGSRLSGLPGRAFQARDADSIPLGGAVPGSSPSSRSAT